MKAMPVVEVFAVRVRAGQSERRYPFTALLYQADAFKRFVSMHFEDLVVAKTMGDVGVESPEDYLTRKVVLWDKQFVRVVGGGSGNDTAGQDV